jgi:hypothetical protein
MKMKKKYCRVTLEPALENRASLWSPAKRREAALTFARWARQLIISAEILERDLERLAQPHLKGLPRRELIKN